MKLLTKDIERRLRSNAGRDDSNVVPVVKFFHPMGGATWLITELSSDGDTLFGLCDLGMGCPELGYVSLNELETTRVRGLGIERDLYFDPKGKTLNEYAKEASDQGRIVA